jgi:hypothetical protein
MAFIELTDYQPIINNEELAVISNNNSNFERETAEKMAMSKIKEMLSRQIDIDYEYAQSGANRNLSLLEYTIYFTLYILYSRIAKAQVPEDRYEQYKEAKEWLKAIQEDKITSTLKRKLSDDQEESPAVRFGSNPRSNHFW